MAFNVDLYEKRIPVILDDLVQRGRLDFLAVLKGQPLTESGGVFTKTVRPIFEKECFLLNQVRPHTKSQLHCGHSRLSQ